MLANAFAYLQAAVDRGVDIDTIGPHIMFIPCFDHYSFFEEIAKLRASRRVYSRIVRDRFNAKNPESWKTRFLHLKRGALYTKSSILTILLALLFLPWVLL